MRRDFKRPPGLLSPSACQKIALAPPAVFVYEPSQSVPSGQVNHASCLIQSPWQVSDCGEPGVKVDRMAMPMKVFLAAGSITHAKALDPKIPAKKRPVFAEYCKDAPTKPSETLDRYLPVKKR